MRVTVAEIVARLGGEVLGNPVLPIDRIARGLAHRLPGQPALPLAT
jgi:hypothetical protein